MVSGLQTGVYDFADLEPSQVEAAEKAGLDVFVQPGFNASNISLNINKAPFDNDKVVDAVRYAVNRQEFVDKVTFGYGEATDQPFPKGYIAYDQESADLYPYDPAKAKKLLAEAGYAARPDHRSTSSMPAASPDAEIVQSQLARRRHHRQHQGRHELGHAVLRQGPRAVDLRHHGPRVAGADPDRALRAERSAQPQHAVPARTGSRTRSRRSARRRWTSPDYAKNLQAATRAGLQSKALVFTYSPPNLFVKSKARLRPARRSRARSTGPA